MNKDCTMKHLLKPIPLALWLAGCSLAPNYEQPDVALPQSWMEVAISEQDNAAAPTADTRRCNNSSAKRWRTITT